MTVSFTGRRNKSTPLMFSGSSWQTSNMHNWEACDMELASQVEGPRFESRRDLTDLKLAAFFPSGPRWQMWLKHRANYYMPPTTTYMFTCMHVGKYVSYLPKVGGFLRVLRFPPPIKLTRHDMTLDFESGVKHQSINQLWYGAPCSRTIFYGLS